MSRKKSFALTVLVGLLLGGVAAGLALRPDWRGRVAKPTLDQETDLLEMEYTLALSKKPYLILDLVDSRLDYRLGGMTLKSLPFEIESIRERGRKGVPAPGRLTLLSIEDRGAPPEVIVPPDPDKPVDPLKDPKLFPPDPPSDYTLLFDRPFKVRILGAKDEGWRSTMEGMGRTVSHWLPWGPGQGANETRIQVRLPAAQAQEIYRALFRLERVLVVGIGEKESTPSSEVNVK